MKKVLVLLIALLTTFSLMAEETQPLQTISVAFFPLQNTNNDPVVSNLESTVYDLLEDQFSFLPEYSLQYISYFKPESLDQFGQAMSQTIFDYGIFGSFRKNPDGTLELAFFSLEKGDNAPRQLTSSTMESFMDIFDQVDQISLLLTESLTGRALRFGTIRLIYPDSVSGAKIFVDGRDSTLQQEMKILTGKHNIQVALLIEDEYRIFRDTDLLVEESQIYTISISESEYLTVQENPDKSVALGEEGTRKTTEPEESEDNTHFAMGLGTTLLPYNGDFFSFSQNLTALDLSLAYEWGKRGYLLLSGTIGGGGSIYYLYGDQVSSVFLYNQDSWIELYAGLGYDLISSGLLNFRVSGLLGLSSAHILDNNDEEEWINNPSVSISFTSSLYPRKKFSPYISFGVGSDWGTLLFLAANSSTTNALASQQFYIENNPFWAINLRGGISIHL